MKRLTIHVLPALLLGALFVLGAEPARAAQGCGPGFHRNVYGYCRPNYGGAYGGPVYRGGAYGYRGVYGRRVYGGRVYGGRVYGGRGFAGRGYGHRVGHYGGRRVGGGRRGWR
jgi:hypothetical protein